MPLLFRSGSRLLQLDPADARAFLGLGVSLAEERRYAEALNAAGSVRWRLDPSMPEAPVKHALIALECGDVSGAVRDRSNRPARTHPDYPFAIAAHAAALACSGDHRRRTAISSMICAGAGSMDVGFFIAGRPGSLRARAGALARSLTMCLQSTEGMAVAL